MELLFFLIFFEEANDDEGTQPDRRVSFNVFFFSVGAVVRCTIGFVCKYQPTSVRNQVS